jgi:hypothetical protein
MDQEWETAATKEEASAELWAKDSAREMAHQGFTVIRVRTPHWRDLKRTPQTEHRFRTAMREKQK